MRHELVDKILNYNAQLPRYTSYPTAPHFTENIESNLVAHWLGTTKANTPISLYLHVPFCSKLCWYCGCHTSVAHRYETVRQYQQLLLKEISLISKRLPSNQKVSHIHFGGGSPGILQPDDFKELMDSIHTLFSLTNNCEIAIELDPRQVTEGKVAAYKQAGVNRVSLGVQDFNDDVQEAINRKQPFRTVYESVQLLREYGIYAINMDLIYGLPKQTKEALKQSIEYALMMEPSRIALFGYAHVPWVKKNMRLIDENTLPGPEERMDMFQMAFDILTNKGLVPIGLDHFVKTNDPMATALKAGTLKRNFQGYTTDDAPTLIGIGTSSIGKLHHMYVQNHLDQTAYEKALLDDELPIKRGMMLSDDDQIRASIIETLMCQLRVDLNAICKQHHISIDYLQDSIGRLAPLEEDGLITISNNVITVHPDARPIVRAVCAAFDAYLVSQDNKHSQMV